MFMEKHTECSGRPQEASERENDQICEAEHVYINCLCRCGYISFKLVVHVLTVLICVFGLEHTVVSPQKLHTDHCTRVNLYL